MAFPRKVRCERRERSASSKRVVARIQKLWTWMDVPQISMDGCLENGGRAFGKEPKVRPLALLRKKEAPRVAMTRMRTEAFLKGRMTS
jgi:hypothetical protein